MSESQPVPVYEMRVECMNYCYGGSPVLDLDEYPDPADPRAIVKYADHLAALAERDRQHAEALAEAEQRWEDWSNELAYILRFVRDHVAALAEVEQRVRDEERSHFQEAVWTFDRGYRLGRAEALRQAREAVERKTWISVYELSDESEAYNKGIRASLAAIDALAAGQAPAAEVDHG